MTQQKQCEQVRQSDTENGNRLRLLTALQFINSLIATYLYAYIQSYNEILYLFWANNLYGNFSI